MKDKEQPKLKSVSIQSVAPDGRIFTTAILENIEEKAELDENGNVSHYVEYGNVIQFETEQE